MDAGGREFRFSGDLYSQESTFPLVEFLIMLVVRREGHLDQNRCTSEILQVFCWDSSLTWSNFECSLDKQKSN